MILALTLTNTQTVEAASDTVVIYEVYGGGDSNGAVYKYDYVVLKNVSDTTQSLDGLYLHKGTAKGAWFDREKVALKGEIAPGAYFVFRGEQPSYKTNGKELPRYDQSATMQIAQSNFAVALTKGSQAPSQTIGGNVIDLVGTNSLNETKPASGANATTSIVRKSDKDTDDNSVDFTTKTHNDGSEPLDYVNETDDSQPEDEKINIYINPNGGKLPAAYDQYTADHYGDIAVPFERDAYHTIPVPTKEGYVFTGYDVDEGTIVDEGGNEQEVRNFLPETDKKYKFSNDEIILTAQWDEIKNSTVTIDPNGGDIKEFYAEKIVPVGQTYKVQPRNVVDLKRDGYKFNGYDVIGTLLDKDGKEVKSIDYLYNKEFTPVGDVTLKARWIEFEGGKVSFEFKFDDGSQFDSTKYQVLLVNLDDQSDIKILQSKNRTKTATGVKAGRYSVKVAGLANDELVKEFKKGSAYGNSGSTSSVNYIDGKTGELTIEFDEEVLDPKAYYYINLEKINLSQTYKLTFDYQNEKQENISSEVESNLPVAINKPEAREGYKFLGYDVEGNLLDSNKNEVTGRFIPEAEEYFLGSDVKLTAVWKEEQYKFTLTGEGVNEITVPGFTRKTEIKLKDVNREGYKFIGWKVEGTLFDSEGKPVTGLITNFDQSYYPGSDVVFTAVWEEVIPESEKASLIIYEVFGGGGKTGSLYANDYVVIKNTGDQTVNLDGMVLRKGLSNRWTDQSVGLSGELAPGAFYVISGGNDNEADGGERPVPAVDLADESFNFANRTFALALTTDDKLPSEENTIDLVGTGKATNFEGKQAATCRNNVSLRRINDGQDTDNNREDFARVEHLRDADSYPLAYLGDKDLRATVTFAFNKAIDGVDIPEAQKVEAGTEITLPEVNPEVKDGYSFLGWAIGDNKYATANLNPGDKITVEEDTNVMGIWEGAYGKVSLTFHTGEFIDDSFENRDKITKLEDDQLAGGGFNVENQQSGQITEGKKSSSKGKISINNGLVKGTYTLNVTAPEGYEIVRIARDTGSNGVIEIENGSTISLPRPEVPFNLTMVDSIYVEVKEKEEEKATVTFSFNKAIDGVDIPEAQKVEAGTEITLPEVNPEVKDGYSFLGWAIGDNKYATANLNPGDKITVEEDTNVMGIWEGAYGKVSLTFHTGEFIDDSFENRDKITKLEDDQLAGGGFNVENQQSGQITEGKKSSSKGKISINNGLVKGTYTLNVTAPEGYEIVRIARDTGSNGVIEIENGSTISLPRPEVPFNLTMVDSIYVEVKEKEEEKATVTFEFDQNIDGAKLPDPITVPVGTEIELPKLDEEVLGDYSFMGWELDKAYPNKADANPGDTITVTEDMTVKGYWEGRYGRFSVHFHEGDYFENKDNLQTLTEGFGFATINPRDNTRLEGVLAGENSKNPYFITPNKAQGGGLTKDAYDLEYTIPEGYKIVSIYKVLADGGLEEVNIDERISPYWYPFNLTMPRGVYVQVEKLAQTYSVKVNGASGDYAETQVKEGEKFYLQTAKAYNIAVKEGEEVIGFEIKKGSLKDKDGKTLNAGDTIKAPENPWTKPQFEALSDVELEPIIKKTSGAILIEVRDDDVHANPDAYKLELEDGNGNIYPLVYDSVSQDNKGKFVLYGYEKISYTDGGRLDSGSYTLRITNDKNRSFESLEVASRPNSVKSSSATVVDGKGQISVDFDQSSGSLPLIRLVARLKDNEAPVELPQGLYIYEIYGGGGLQQSYYANDYVILQNKSDTDIDLAGINLHVSNQWRPEYAYNIPLSGTIKANDYFVIKAGAGFKSGEQKELPRVDLDLSGGKLYQNDFDYQAIGLALTMGPEEPNEKNTIDKVGTYYNNQYLVKPATSPHVDSSIRRVAYDDVNKTDFTKVSHRPYIAGTADHREPLWYLKDRQEEKVRVRFAHNAELTNNETPAEQNVWSGTKITLPQVNKEEKYEFKGWDVDGDGIADKEAGEEFEVKENVTITGIWEEEKPEVKTINFVVDPEKGSAIGALFAEVIEGEDPLAKAPKVEAKEGYNFVRWEASEDGLTYTAIFEEAQKPVELIRDRSIRFEVQETIAGDSQLSVKTSKAGDVVVIEINGQEVLRKASNEADVFETYELNTTVKLNDKISVYIIRDKQYRSSKINNIINN